MCPYAKEEDKTKGKAWRSTIHNNSLEKKFPKGRSAYIWEHLESPSAHEVHCRCIYYFEALVYSTLLLQLTGEAEGEKCAVISLVFLPFFALVEHRHDQVSRRCPEK